MKATLLSNALAFSLAFLFSLSVKNSVAATLDMAGGCTNQQACNFDPSATFDDGSCIFISAGGFCAGPIDDSTCTSDLSTFVFNVLDNDVLVMGTQVFVMPLLSDVCFHINDLGQVQYNDQAGDCCGDHFLSYALTDEDDNFLGTAEVFICVTCPKPDCTLINLEDYAGGSDGTMPDGPGCVSVCENSITTFYLPLDTNSTYVWGPIIGGNWVPGANDAEIIVTWGSYGSGSISVTITDGNGNVQAITVCIDIMQAPTASFTSAGYVCLGQNLCFNNTSANADTYFWDFGDGGTSPLENPCYTYANPGTYTVTLCASNFNYDEEGNPLCCCTDCVTMQVIVDPLPGPNIYCISTLCEGDESCYTTDATNCSSYLWTVLDANGNPVVFTGQGTDEICLTWGIGPVGTITLDVSGCDSTYCNNPTTVNVPIIATVSTITGPIVVCEFATETYSLPKWLSTVYLWTVTGGMVIAGDSTNIATIQWGPAGVGTIHVDYCSEFLQGLPGHDAPECCGTADLTVLILPEFFMVHNGPSVVCLGTTTSFSATNFPLNSYTWTVFDTNGNPLPFSGQGTDNISVTWTTAGTYIITATPTATSVYCNTTETVVVTVLDVPKATAITGPTQICPNQVAYYTAVTGSTGVSFVWTAQNGTLSSTSGTTVGVTWGPTGPYSISLAQQLSYNPFCLSDTITLLVYPKNLGGPFTITGTANCTNSVQQYTLNGTLHPEATINWSVSLPIMGSVVNGQGSTMIDVQWNNTPGGATVTADLTLCGVTTPITLGVTLVSPQIPVVTQSGNLCPGGSAFLNASGGCFNTYSWSTGDITVSSQIFTAAQYSLTTTDCNNCAATVYFNAIASPSPIAAISSGNNPIICIPAPHTVTMVAQCNASYTYEWFCNNASVSGPSLGNCTYSHVFQGVAGTYTYYIEVVDPTTGCTSTSLPFYVYESDCLPGGCTPEAYTLTPSFTVSNPYCNQITFSFTSSVNFTFTSWSFGDNTFSGSPNPTHTYLQAGCYNVQVHGTVPDSLNPPAQCPVYAELSVCVPLAADFSFTAINCTQVQFTDLSTIIPPGAYTLFWNAGIYGTSTLTNPVFTFPGPGIYPVTLTINDGNGCQATITKNVTLGGVGTPIITAPLKACVGEPVAMSVFATGAVSYFWDFGDGATYTGASPSHTYLFMGTYTIIVTATDSNGCTATSSTTILIHPPVAPGVITGTLLICAGDTTALCAPAGYSYLWTPNGETTQCIDVTIAGTYGVAITDGNGCSLELDPVEVVVLPLPIATIAGNLIICDAGCTILTTPFDPNFTYQWYDNLGNLLAPEIYNQIYVCDYNLLGGYYVMITDQNGCSATSATVVVAVAVSPVFTITVSPVACAGQPVTLTVTPIDPNVNYNWSNGGTGTSITVTQAGTYTCVGTDINTGCSGSASATVYPLPDFCIVPQGCYQVCNPDTVCGPPGMASYQWNLNGNPIAGGNMICLEITQSGIYTLTATTVNGCSDTSVDLDLTVIECDSVACDELHVDFSLLDEDADGVVDSCCAILSYTNNFGGLQGFTISTSDADLNFDLSSLSTSLAVQSVTANSIALASSIAGDSIPTGTLSNFITFCISNVINSPQQIIIDWYDFDDEIVCSDTLEFHCPEEPECIYMTNDSIYCEDGSIFYEFTVCNPNDQPYSIGYINILPSSPAGVVVTPPFIDITSTPILAGTCQTFTVNLSGNNIGGETFCYNLIAHQNNPLETDSIICCSVDTTYCIEIPVCDPCLFVSVENVESDTTDGCCFNITLNNAYDPNFFDEIALCVLSPQTTITVNNPFSSPWTTSGFTSTAVSFLPENVFNNFVPGGGFTLPQICVQTNLPPFQQIEIKWMKDSTVVCRDTINVSCDPPCGYMVQESIVCDPVTGTWNYQAALHNVSGIVVTHAQISFNTPAGLSIYNQTISLGSLNSGSTSPPFNINVGAPAMAGDTVCFTVALIKQTPDSTDVACCFFEHCIVLPDCPPVVACLCDDTFSFHVGQGIACTPVSGNPNTFIFSLQDYSYFQDCDEVKWRFELGAPLVVAQGTDSVMHTFPTGTFTVCVRVTRFADNGVVCKANVCKTVVIPEAPQAPLANDPELMMIYPNPNNGMFKIMLYDDTTYPLDFTIYNSLNQPVLQKHLAVKPEGSMLEIDLTDKAKGMYVLQFKIGDDMFARKIVVY